MSATSILGKYRSLDLDQRRRISLEGGSGLRRLRTAISGGVCIDGVKMLGVMRIGVNKCDTRDSIAGELFSKLTTVYELESSLCMLVRNELKRVVDNCGLY